MSSLAKNLMKALVLIVMLAACASNITPPAGDRYTLRITDNLAERRFDVALTSHDSRSLCVSIENWPNSSGHFTVEKGDTLVKIGPDLLPAESKLMSAYCPGGCGEYRIEPQGELRGFISYEAFGDANALAKDTNKELKFPVFPYYCPKNAQRRRVHQEAADPLFLKAAMSPSDFDGREVVVRAWITLRHEDKNLWATWLDHEDWKTVHCISLIDCDSLDASLDGRYVEVTGVVRSDASNGGNTLRFASCREVAIEVAGPSAIRLITR